MLLIDFLVKILFPSFLSPFLVRLIIISLFSSIKHKTAFIVTHSCQYINSSPTIFTTKYSRINRTFLHTTSIIVRTTKNPKSVVSPGLVVLFYCRNARVYVYIYTHQDRSKILKRSPSVFRYFVLGSDKSLVVPVQQRKETEPHQHRA